MPLDRPSATREESISDLHTVVYLLQGIADQIELEASPLPADPHKSDDSYYRVWSAVTDARAALSSTARRILELPERPRLKLVKREKPQQRSGVNWGI